MTANVLHLSYSNAAGLPQTWCRAHREAGVEATHVAEIESAFGFESDAVRRWSLGREDLIRPFVDDCTHIVVHDVPSYCDLARRSGKPWMYRAFGTHTYLAKERVLRDTADVPRVCDFTEYCPAFTWLPMPVWREEYPEHQPTDEFTVCHAPSNRVVKGTAGIIRACAKVGVRLELLENLSHPSCLRRKARCHVLVDMIVDENHPRPERSMGFAINGIEAWAIGMPVLGEQSPEVRPEQDLLLDVLRRGRPYIHVTEETLPEMLIQLRDHPYLRSSWVGAGQRYLRTFHDPLQQASRDLVTLGAA